MKHLVVGAGATFGEALALGNSQEASPPLIRDFARKTWSSYTPHPMLEIYLRELGYQELGFDPRELFYDLEEKQVTSIEQFMEFAWANRGRQLDVSDTLPPGYIAGFRLGAHGSESGGDATDNGDDFWENLLYHGIGSPLSFYMSQCFFENGKGWRDLQLSKSIAARIQSADLVLNLNYDTVFELALMQLRRSFAYAPNRVGDQQLLVCKPHGSLNMVVNDSKFTFGQPEWLGMPEAPGYRSYSGLIPPRLSKRYEQHPIAKIILAPVLSRRPDAIVMWGVGLTESDEDLIDLYRHWLESADVLDIINPDDKVAAKAAAMFGVKVRHFVDASTWVTLSAQGA
jgi:hypothetical protein